MAKKIVNVVYKVDSKELDAVKKSLQSNQQEAKKFDDSLKKVDKTAKDTGKDMQKSFLDFKNILATISFVGILSGLTSLGKKIFDLGVQQEQLNIAFTTFLGSAEKAKKLMAELTKFSIITPFTPEQVNKAAKTLLAFGTQAKDIIPTLKMIGDVSAGTGKDLAEMAVIFGQIQSTGRLMGQDLLQLINAGFNPLQIISEKTGKSVKVLKEEMEKGLISFDMVKQAFKDATSEGGLFFNLMEKQSQSVGGKISTIAGNLDEVMKAIFASNTGIIKDFVDILEDATEGLLFFFETADQKQTKYEQSVIERFEASGLSIEKEIEIQEGRIKQRQAEIESYLDMVKKFGESAGVTPDMISAREQEILVIKRELAVIEKLRKEKNQEAEDARKNAPPPMKITPSEDKDLSFWKPISDDAVLEAQDTLYDYKDLLADFNKDITQQLKDQYKTEEELRKEATDKAVKDEADKQQKIKDIKQQAFNFGIDLLGGILMASLQSNNTEMQAIDERYAREIELAGNNEQAKKSLEKRREQERKEALKRQEQEERNHRVKVILAEALVNSVKALGLPPIPGANFIAAAQALAYGALQAGLVGKYKDGGWISGPGTPTSDSVPILASRDEFMVNAAAAAQSPNLLEAINDRKINDNILRAVASTGGRQVNILDDSRIVKAIQENRVDYINHGYTLMKVQKSGENFKRMIRSKIQGY
jgi:tape measure domain-containing protein